MLDVVITGGTAVLPSGAQRADIGIAGEKIAAIGAPGALAGLGGRVVDAAGQIVIPGGIDPHVHCRWPMPTPGQSQANLTDGPDRVSQAALFGGTTTILDFALVDGDNTVQQAIERRQKEWAGDCHCDYAFHTMVQGKLDLVDPRSTHRGGRRRPPDGQDVHHRHHPVAQGPHGAVRQHHGGTDGAGEGGRARRDPRRG